MPRSRACLADTMDATRSPLPFGKETVQFLFVERLSGRYPLRSLTHQRASDNEARSPPFPGVAGRREPRCRPFRNKPFQIDERCGSDYPGSAPKRETRASPARLPSPYSATNPLPSTALRNNHALTGRCAIHLSSTQPCDYIPLCQPSHANHIPPVNPSA